MTNSFTQIKKGFFGLKPGQREKRRSRKTSIDTMEKKKQDPAEDNMSESGNVYQMFAKDTLDQQITSKITNDQKMNNTCDQTELPPSKSVTARHAIGS